MIRANCSPRNNCFFFIVLNTLPINSHGLVNRESIFFYCHESQSVPLELVKISRKGVKTIVTVTNKFFKIKFDGYFYKGEGEKLTLVQKLGTNLFSIVCCIANFQGQGGHSDLTIDQLTHYTGISRKTVQREVNKLKEFTYEGKPVVEITEGTYRNKKKLFYRLCPNPVFSVYGESNEVNLTLLNEFNGVNLTPSNDINGVKMTSTKETNITKELITKEIEEGVNVTRERMSNKEIVSHFKSLIEEKTGEKQKVHYPKVMTMLKKVEGEFDGLINNDIKRLLSIVVENYESWSSPQYPLKVEVISRKWVLDRAKKELEKNKRELSQMQEQNVVASERQKVALDSIMSRIKKKGGQR
jgi:hypothetical protein